MSTGLILLSPDEQVASFPSPPLTPGTSFSSLASYSPTCSEISFYANADLILEVFPPSPSSDAEKNKHTSHNAPAVHRLRVASVALCIASPVFRAMLSPDRFREGNSLSDCARAGKLFTLALPDDDPDAMITLCHILHFNHYKVPRTISVEALARLCIVLDKYVCTLAAASWIDYWFSHMPYQMKHGGESIPELAPKDPNEPLLDLMWLFIAFVVGDRQRFRHFSTKVVVNLQSGERMNEENREWFDRLPSRIQDALITASQDAILDIAKLITDFCSGKLAKCQVTPDQTRRRPWGEASITSKDCDAHFIGALLLSLQNPSSDDHMDSPSRSTASPFSILADPGSWDGSVNDLLKTVERSGQELMKTKFVVYPHSMCVQGRTFYRKLREVRYDINNERGLDLAEFRAGSAGQK